MAYNNAYNVHGQDSNENNLANNGMNNMDSNLQNTLNMLTNAIIDLRHEVEYERFCQERIKKKNIRKKLESVNPNVCTFDCSEFQQSN